MTDETCPVCKSSKYLNPKLTLLVSPCYHRMCETCINRLFLHGNAPCPICGTVLRKGNFVVATFEDLRVEKEVRIRKVVQKAFFKLPEDFDDDKGYNNYLEEVEDIVFRLVNDVDVQNTYARLEAFRLENRPALEAAHARQAHDQRQAEAAERAAQEEKERQRGRERAEEAAEEAQRSAAKRSIIDELANSNAPAAVVLAEAQKKLRSSSSSSASNANSASKATSIAPLKLRPQRGNLKQSTIQFDPLSRHQPLSTRLPLPQLSGVDDSIVLELMEEFMPKAPSAMAMQKREWRIEAQMLAGGFTVDLIKRHCLKAALSWGL